MNTTQDLQDVALDSVIDGRYAVKRQIAIGGMSSVFDAEHLTTGASVALKTLRRPALHHEVPHERMLREARILGGLRHPNIVAIHDAGRCARHGTFLALERVDGRALDSVLAARRVLPIEQAVAVALEVCSALECLHLREIVHRDVKPSNLLLSPGATHDRVTLIDFGVAKVPSPLEARKLTQFGEILGTVEYMSPEQLTSRPSGADPRSDLYAVGVLLYECLSGEVPFSGPATSIVAHMLDGARSTPLSVLRPEVPAPLEAVIARALELDPSSRYASARELAEDLVAAFGPVEGVDLLAFRAGPRRAPDEDPTRKRRFARAPYVTPVRLVLDEGLVVDGRTADISEGGALVLSDAECSADRPVKLRIPLPTSGRVMSVDAVTRWTKRHREDRTIGVEFEELPPVVREDIATYVRLMSGR